MKEKVVMFVQMNLKVVMKWGWTSVLLGILQPHLNIFGGQRITFIYSLSWIRRHCGCSARGVESRSIECSLVDSACFLLARSGQAVFLSCFYGPLVRENTECYHV